MLLFACGKYLNIDFSAQPHFRNLFQPWNCAKIEFNVAHLFTQQYFSLMIRFFWGTEVVFVQILCMREVSRLSTVAFLLSTDVLRL